MLLFRNRENFKIEMRVFCAGCPRDLRRLFKPNNDLIPFVCSEHSVFLFGSFFVQ
jgi:hypothetical protein